MVSITLVFRSLLCGGYFLKRQTRTKLEKLIFLIGPTVRADCKREFVLFGFQA